MIDIFNHILPGDYLRAVDRLSHGSQPLMFDRARQIPAMADIDARLRVMDAFPGYQQLISLSSPTIDALVPKSSTQCLAKCANDSLAQLVDNWPDRFPGFVATLPLDQPEAAQREAERAIRELHAAGVQVYTSVGGQPLDRPEFLELFACLAELGRPVWLHPIRTMNSPDYPTEAVSKFDLWWAFGWPHETSIAMGRLVFAGIFDRWPDLSVITHHVGGTIPLFAGRIESGLSTLGSRNAPEHASAVATNLRDAPINAFRRFYADTASFGSRAALDCGREFFGIPHMLFATDMPFDPEQGPGYIRSTILAINQMSLCEAERTAIFEGNIKRLLRWN